MTADIRHKAGKVLALGISMLLILSGCEQKNVSNQSQKGGTQLKGENMGHETAKGRYLETPLEVPDGFSGNGSFCIRKDGSLCLVNMDQGSVYVSRDGGGTWKGKEYKELTLLAERDGDSVEVTSAVPSPDGGVFVSYTLWGEKAKGKAYPEKYLYIDKDGKTDEFELGLDHYHAQVQAAVFTSRSELFVGCNNNKIYQFDLKRHKAKCMMSTYVSEGGGPFACGQCVGAYDGDKCYFYDRKSRKMVEGDDVLNKFVAGEIQKSHTIILGGGDEEKVLAASEEGIFSHVMQGNVMEQLAEGSLTNLTDPSKEPQSIYSNSEGEIFILYSDGMLASYAYDAEAPSVPERQLTVYSLYDNATMRQAINGFRRENPDTYIKMDIGVSGEDGVAESDAIKKLNTDLLAGEGPDILLLDGMPMDSYIEKGTLLNLSDFVEKLQSKEEYYDNLLLSYQKDSDVYALPMRCQLPIAAGEKNIINKMTDISSLADIVKKYHPDKGTVIGAYTPQELLKRLYPVCEGAWLKEDGSLDEQAIEEFFTQAREIYQAEQKGLDKGEISSHNQMLERLDKEADGNLSDPFPAQMQVYHLLQKMQGIAAGIFQGMDDMKTMTSYIRQYGGAYGLFSGQQKDVFIPHGILGIAADCSQQKFALEFAEYILGSEVQAKDLEDGFPVNRTAFKQFSENPDKSKNIPMITVAGSAGQGGTYDLTLEWPSSKDIDRFDKMLGEVSRAAGNEQAMQQEIIDIGARVLSGEREVKDGVQEVMQKVTLLYQE